MGQLVLVVLRDVIDNLVLLQVFPFLQLVLLVRGQLDHVMLVEQELRVHIVFAEQRV